MSDVVFMTSGSTGAPKRIVRSSEQLDRDAAALVATFSFLAATKPNYVFSIRSEHLYGALWRDRVPRLAGCAVHSETIISVEQLDSASSGGNSIFVTTPSFLEKALENPDFRNLHGRFVAIITSGGPLRGNTAKTVHDQLGVCPLEIYGSTEAGSIAWRRQSESDEANLLPGVLATTDAKGQLVITSSPFAMETPMTMPDSVQFVSERSFKLLGRSDRMIKVLEEFVSLKQVETAFEGHPYIERARAEGLVNGVVRVGILLVASAAGRNALATAGFAKVAAALRRDLIDSIGFNAFPRRMRFVRAFPADERGKTTSAAVIRTINARMREPVVLEWSATANALDAMMVFPGDMECFNGHFPGCPVLAGVVQLAIVRHFALCAFGRFPAAASYRKLKFRRLIHPWEKIRLQISTDDRGSCEFLLSVGDEIACSGSVSEILQ